MEPPVSPPPAPSGSASQARWLNRDVLVVLAVLLSILFLFLVDLRLVRSYEQRQIVVSRRFFSAGLQQLLVHQPDQAISSFRTALLYSRDNPEYRQRLAEALIDAKHYNEAASYLGSLLDEEPANSVINLDLARLAVLERNNAAAMRYFHGAIYGQWQDEPALHRREARLELINFLLQTHQNAQAQSELLALASELPNVPELQIATARLFERVQDDSHALDLYRKALQLAPRNAAAAAGAGASTFRLGDFKMASPYLRKAVAENPSDRQSDKLLKLSNLVLAMDPYQRGLRRDERNLRVLQAFRRAGERWQQCSDDKKEGAAKPGSTGAYVQWLALKPKMSVRALDRDPDLGEKAMDTAFQMEQQTAVGCANPALADEALLLLSKHRRESEP